MNQKSLRYWQKLWHYVRQPVGNWAVQTSLYPADCSRPAAAAADDGFLPAHLQPWRSNQRLAIRLVPVGTAARGARPSGTSVTGAADGSRATEPPGAGR